MQPPQEPYLSQQPPYYVPSQPQYAPPPPPKKKNKGLIAALVALLVVFACIGTSMAARSSNSPSSSVVASTNSTEQVTQIPTATSKSLHWTTIQTFSGNGSKKTATFAVPGDWKITWSCNPASFDNINYNVMIDVYNSDGSSADIGAVNSMCQSGSISGDDEEHQAGNVYLDVTSEGNWTITVQALQ